MAKKAQIKISVYLDNGRVFEYEVASPDKGREHVSAIINGCDSTQYKDTVRAT